MLKTYKYRLYPTKEQSHKMHEICFLCSLVYNQFLEERREAWEIFGVSLSCYEQIKALPIKKEDDPRLKQVFSQVLQDVARRVDKTFRAFFRRVKAGETPGYPRFKPAQRYNSFTYPQSGFSLKDNRLVLSKIGPVKIKLHRPMDGKVKTLTIRRQNGKWYACFSVEIDAVPLPPTGKVCGIDMGLEKFLTTSNGEMFHNPRQLRQAEKKLKQHQRRVSRRKKGSNRRKKAVRDLARCHEKVANQRRDLHHKVACSLVNRYDMIAIEDLQVKNMTQNHHLAKSIADAGWGNFRLILTSKAESAGRKVVEVDPKHTSQLCSRCGAEVKKKLSQRWHHCPACGLSIDRDVNAAINILKRAV
ncbi:transposase, IS605 OrfB family, central region [Desulforamulus putei DSM 12395]|uniref:Transposase, IS605 OrfB family, central region n=1 Tax=Desulforamulus putei DSM 12395 TaxID=1121429 RepID=A0A1M5C3V5_9FIRM|nr:RNA-guided endonuclease TnpB family protein [Desulforamulus putei]SHF49122.1 transposase, IS605 OrfB family, central region [Desulforamulus putei DSM 12395]